MPSHHKNIHEAAFTINSAYRFFPRGTIHVIIVDPGVGSDRQNSLRRAL